MMINAMDVGYFQEACRAQRAVKDGAVAVDIDLLNKLVSAVTRAPSVSSVDNAAASEANNSPALVVGSVGRSPNKGLNLWPMELDLLERVILPRVALRDIFYTYAQLDIVMI